MKKYRDCCFKDELKKRAMCHRCLKKIVNFKEFSTLKKKLLMK